MIFPSSFCPVCRIFLNRRLAALSLLFFYFPFWVGCESDGRDGSLQQLSFRPDTVRFDSVFTGSISSTKLLAIRNRGSGTVRLDGVSLQHEDGQYALLMDGVAGSTMGRYDLAAGDSLLVAVRLSPHRGGVDTVSVADNAIRFLSGGEDRSVPLLAKGLAVDPIRIDTLRADWHIEGPPALMVERTLYVPKGKTLRITGGAALYFRAGASLVVDGVLQIEGDRRRSVVFAGDRLETYYRRKPGQWGGISLRPGSGPHALRWVEVRGAVCGVRADSLAVGAPLVVEHCRFLFNSLEGIDAGFSRVEIRSSLFAQNYRHALRLRNAHATLTHCTLYGVSAPPQTRVGALLSVSHDGVGELPSFSISNSILWGDRENEVEPALRGEYAERFAMRYSLAKVNPEDTVRLSSWEYIVIDNPQFASPGQQRFSLKPKSPARGRALKAVSQVDSVDLQGLNRTKREGNADLGAFEFTPDE